MIQIVLHVIKILADGATVCTAYLISLSMQYAATGKQSINR